MYVPCFLYVDIYEDILHLFMLSLWKSNEYFTVTAYLILDQPHFRFPSSHMSPVATPLEKWYDQISFLKDDPGSWK